MQIFTYLHIYTVAQYYVLYIIYQQSFFINKIIPSTSLSLPIHKQINTMKVTYHLQSSKSQTKHKQHKQSQPSSQWQTLVNSLVRPPRMRYNQTQIGYKHFKINNREFARFDQTVYHGNQGKKLHLSSFIPNTRNYKLILYLHGNSSSKIQSKGLLEFLPNGYTLSCFDFLGCGNNMEEDFITLGYSQSQQVQTVVTHLQKQNYKVYLWGRSMGAVSALKYGKTDIIVADSPFRSMKKLCKQLSTSKVNPLPNCLVNCLFPCVFMKLRSDIKKRGNYDLQDLDIQKCVENISPMTILIFICGKEDDLVHYNNSQKLFNKFKGSKKYIEVVQGNHNTKRPVQVMQKIMRIIQQNSNWHQPICTSQKTQKIQIKL